MASDKEGRNDLVLTHNQFALILDETKGVVNTYCGPFKSSLSAGDKPVIFNAKTKAYEEVDQSRAPQKMIVAPEGWYIVLYNPAKDDKHPVPGTSNSQIELLVGKKVNLAGPRSFAPWPGQYVKVVKGHSLRTNQYLLCVVYDDVAARENWSKAVIKHQKVEVPASTKGDDKGADAGAESKAEDSKTAEAAVQLPPDLTVGQLLIIKGTEVSFYIPPTGIKVVPDSNGDFVREAVTLELLEYCILLDEDGNKTYIRGPKVVFPKPTEKFVEEDGQRKFRAYELNPISAIHVKVIFGYTEKKDGKDIKHEVGEELLITGNEESIYYPRKEHAIIKYGESDMIYAVAVPAGEARYVLNRLSGEISKRVGPCMLLPDPRKEVIVRRILDAEMVKLLYPGNATALLYNEELRRIEKQQRDKDKQSDDYIEDRDLRSRSLDALGVEPTAKGGSFGGNEFNRKTAFTPPRSIVLDTKYEGAPTVNIWTGYALLLSDKNGKRRVEVGPQTVLLDYSEFPEAMTLSTGTPKSDDKTIKTAFLRVLNNKVSDRVTVETSDLVSCDITLSLRVNFEGDKNKWFDVENFVKFLTDHTRSMLRNAVKKIGIEQFYAGAIDIVRDTILGKSGEDTKRPGRSFSENGMRVYDVEVLDVKIGDTKIGMALAKAMNDTVAKALELRSKKQELDFVKECERMSQETAVAKSETLKKSEKLSQEDAEAKSVTVQSGLDLRIAEAKKQLELNIETLMNELKVKTKRLEDQLANEKISLEARLAREDMSQESRISLQKADLDSKLENQDSLDKISDAEIKRQKAQSDQDLAVAKTQLENRLNELAAQAKAYAERVGAVDDKLIAAIQTFGDKQLMSQIADKMAPLAILGGKSAVDVILQLIQGTGLEKLFEKKASQQQDE